MKYGSGGTRYWAPGARRAVQRSRAPGGVARAGEEVLPRELDERLGLGALIERHTGANFQFALPDLFRQSGYSRLAGYLDTNDAERLAQEPAFRMLASRERRETSVALTSSGPLPAPTRVTPAPSAE